MSGPVLYERVNQKKIEFSDCTEFTIGRSQTCDLNIPQTCISRCQCIIKKTPDGEWLIVDKSSFQSTFLNGNKIPQNGLVVKSLDLITFGNLGSYQLVFYESQNEAPSSVKRRRLDDQTPLSEQLETVKNEKAAIEAKLKQMEAEKERVDEILIRYHLDCRQVLEELESGRTEIDRLAQERDEFVEALKTKGTTEARAVNQSELESNFIMKSIELEELKDELQDSKSRLEEATQTMQALNGTTEKLYNDAVAVLEQEFLCCVCSDLLYQPVTLNCRHTICKDCLKEWKKKKKECPSCRTKIKSEVSPLIIDAFIDRIAPLLGEEFLKRREESKRERTAPQTPPRASIINVANVGAARTDYPIVDAGPSRGNTGGRGRGRARRQRAPPASVPLPYLIPGIIDLTAGARGPT